MRSFRIPIACCTNEAAGRARRFRTLRNQVTVLDTIWGIGMVKLEWRLDRVHTAWSNCLTLRYHNPCSVSEYLKTVQDVDAGVRSFGQNHLSVIE